MCTNLAQETLTPSGLSRFDSTHNLDQTLLEKVVSEQQTPAQSAL